MPSDFKGGWHAGKLIGTKGSGTETDGLACFYA
jgi:hypothetical protein